jgi:hypothetical protein
MAVLATLAAGGVFGFVLLAVPSQAQTAPAADGSIRPFHFNVPEEQLVDLRRRIAATKWPERENVSDATQGVPLATMQKLAHYWASDYDGERWRRG